MKELDLQQRVANLLAPLRNDKEALQAAITIHLHENVLRILNGGDDRLDVIEAELRHQAQALIDPQGTLLKKASTFTDFLEQDIKHRLQQAAQEGLEARTRVDSIAEEASLDIHQLLAEAKKDLPRDVRPLLKPKIETLEATYSTVVVRGRLRAYLGLHFVDDVRHELQKTVVDAQHPFDRSELDSRAEALASRNREILDRATATLHSRFKKEQVRALVNADLDALATVFADEGAMKEKLAAFAQEQ